MKKQTGSRTGGLIKKAFNIEKWSDWQRVRGSAIYLIRGVGRLFIVSKPKRVESFSEAQKRLGISDIELQQRAKGLQRLFLLMICFAMCLFFYAMYLVVFGGVVSVILSLVVCMIACSLAFRYHFWYYQIKARRLGCSLRDWFYSGLLGRKQ